MSKRCWVVSLGVALGFGLALAAQADSFKGLFHPGGKQQQEQIRQCIKGRAWIAYLRDDDGRLSPVRDTQNTDSDKDWLGLRFSEYEGPRIRLGVLKVFNRSADNDERGNEGRIQVPVAGIQEILTQALYNTRRFDVIEQKRIEEVEKQQKRKDVLEPSPTSIVNVGKVIGAQYLVYGTVNEWNPDRASHGGGGGVNGLFGKITGNIKGEKNEAEVAITFALTDVANGQILFTTTERAKLGSTSFKISAQGGNTDSGDKTPVSYAIRACANKAAFRIAVFLRDRKWKGSVVDIKLPEIYINAGKEQGMAAMTKLLVQSVRGIIRDRENGTTLGEDLRGIGTLQVVAVQNGFAIAEVAEGCDKTKVKVGDRVELASDPLPPPKVPGCDEGGAGSDLP